ncbi:flagellar biosynthesis repressor FlbT [Polycladidibacter hongkongensis]|uniref:flagellar biosynthesis repressor FlbT n=1 Tax=Polycladidibacter hongkongensis TaxID=1647556 RepID=UPI0009EAE9F1|nr:flagellar biosynthesis repressor FlbT [Pseudovibrio hongkongensis]
MRIHLKAGEKVFINGAVLSFDQKTTLNLLNDARFLLGSYVMQLEETTTPLRQLYFAVQDALINPQGDRAALVQYQTLLNAIRRVSSNIDLHEGLDLVASKVEQGRYFDALKALRKLFVVEQDILNEFDSHALDVLPQYSADSVAA